jgi:GT2 family glycosyltransferase
MSDADVIVLDIDGGEMLRACLDSIFAQTRAPHRVIVFDNGSRTPVRDARATVIRSETNLGFAGGVNAAFAQTTAEYIALINNDAVLDRDWLQTVVDALDANPKLAAVQTVIRRDENTIDGAGIDWSDGTIRQVTPASGRLDGRPPAARPCKGDQRSPGQPAGGRRCGISATAALYRRAALGDRIFDERFFAYYEDVELSARLLEAGWQLQVIDEIKATHRGSQSASRLGRRALYLRTRNRYFVARLHRGTARIGALLWEDVKLLLRGRSSLRGMIAGLCSRLS